MSRLTQVPPRRCPRTFGYGAFTLCGRRFHAVPLVRTAAFVGGPTTPAPALRRSRFGLVRFRSPLLAQSLLLSLPPGT